MKRESRKKINLFLDGRIREGRGAGIKISLSFARKQGRPRWSRYVEGRILKLTSKSVVIDEGGLLGKVETQVPLDQVMEAYYVSGCTR